MVFDSWPGCDACDEFRSRSGNWVYGVCLGRAVLLWCNDVCVVDCRAEEISYRL